ncbi:MAG: hypothetical protein OXH39_23270 [Candidatus Poribacteria bacterium]|nr:hypothetical protein [Candidatus Poribacteria bacterium]
MRVSYHVHEIDATTVIGCRLSAISNQDSEFSDLAYKRNERLC